MIRSRPSGSETRWRIPKQKTKSNVSSSSPSLERLHTAVFDARAEQLGDRAETLAALQLTAPARSHPLDVLLAVDGEHPLRPARLGDEGIEAVKGAHVKDAERRKARRQEWQPIPVVDRHARCVDTLGAIQRERVKPERDLAQHTPRRRGIHLNAGGSRRPPAPASSRQPSARADPPTATVAPQARRNPAARAARAPTNGNLRLHPSGERRAQAAASRPSVYTRGDVVRDSRTFRCVRRENRSEEPERCRRRAAMRCV